MSDSDRVKYLKAALVVFGLIFLVGIYPLTILWPSGWSWHMGYSDYLPMIIGVYATLGLFTVWSSVVHGGIMAVQSFGGPEKMGHLWGDVAALFLVAIVLGVLTPRGAKA
jgi:hypothetical protein